MDIIEKQLVVDDMLLTYYEMGRGERVVLFLHGWGSNSTLWFKTIEALCGPAYRFLFLDLPGFGKSESPKRALHLDDFARYVHLFSTKLALPPYLLVGHSFGGKSGVRLVATHPDDVVGLVLVDASGLPHTSSVTQAKIVAAKTLRPFFNLSFMHGIKSKVLRLIGSDDYVADPRLKETFIHIIQEHVTADLVHIKVPTLILWGDQDANAYTPIADAVAFHHAIEGSELIILAGATHYSFLDKPQEFRAAFEKFFARMYGKN